MILLFFTGFALSLSLCLDLGTVNMAVLREGAARGFWPAFLMGVGSSFGDLTYAVLGLAGVGLLLDIPAVRIALWIGGTITLLAYTVIMIRGVFRPTKPGTSIARGDTAPAPPRSSVRSILWGWGLALSSPTAILWFATVVGSVVATSPVRGAAAMTVFLGGFFCCSIVWSLGIARLASYSGQRLGQGFARAISALSALLFLYFAADVFLDGYREFLQH